MKFRVRKNDHDNVIEFDANYFSDSILNSLENINCKHDETVKVALRLSLDDFESEPYNDLFITDSIDDIISRLQELTRPIKKNDGTVIPHKIMVGITYDKIRDMYDACSSNYACFLKSVTHKKFNDSSADLELEFIGGE